MSFASNMLPMVLRRLRSEGSTMSLHFQDMNGTYDPETGTNTTVADVVIPVSVVKLDIGNFQQSLMTKAGTTIEANTKEFYMTPCGTSNEAFPRSPSPASDYLIDASGTRWGIKSIVEYNPTGSAAIMYDMLVGS